MSNTTQETIHNIDENVSEPVFEETETYTESNSEPAITAETIGDQLDLSGYNLNTIRPEVFRALSYWQKWSLRRQAGLFFYAATYAVYTFVGYVGVKMFYLVYAKNFQFKLDWWSFPLAIGVGLAYWFIHEAIYKSKLSAASKK